MHAHIEKIRSVRTLQTIALKPTPYLIDKYVDEFGESREVKLRDYQKIGIMNTLMVPNSILGDATGLGKTLQILSVIGYIWLKEPEYIPIVVTKKSALFQWESETKKFMQNMNAITVHGQPYERDIIYSKFFKYRDLNDKSLMILTYDNILKDGEPNVVKDRTVAPPKELKKALKEARKEVKEAKAKINQEKLPFNTYMKSRTEDVRCHMIELLKTRDDESTIPKPPASWTDHDQKVYDHIIRLRSAFRAAENHVKKLGEEAAPSFVAPGIIGYMQELLASYPDKKFLLIMDEVHAVKNYRGKIHDTTAKVASLCARRIGMTATPIKNRLLEFFSIFQIIEPSVFPKITHFYRDHCHIKMQKIGGGRQVPIVVGHSKEHLESFVSKIEPYYLARQKHEVAKELPELISRELKCELSDEQEELYDMAEIGLLSKTDEEAESNGAELLSALVLVQQACNAPQLIANEDGIPFEGKSSKIETLIDVLEDEAEGMKVIVFSRFEKMISLIEKRLIEKGIKCTRITGAESKASVREANKNSFQDMKSGVNVILITAAGSESINLQAAEHIICMDSPWSYGDYIQLIGRAIRIGSKNKIVIVTHLVAMRQSGKATIDDHVIKILRGKKRLSDKVSGVSLKDGLQFVEKDAAMDLFRLIAESRDTVVDVTKLKKIAAKSIHSASSRKKAAPVELPEDKASTPDFDFSDI